MFQFWFLILNTVYYSAFMIITKTVFTLTGLYLPKCLKSCILKYLNWFLTKRLLFPGYLFCVIVCVSFSYVVATKTSLPVPLWFASCCLQQLYPHTGILLSNQFSSLRLLVQIFQYAQNYNIQIYNMEIYTYATKRATQRFYNYVYLKLDRL